MAAIGFCRKFLISKIIGRKGRMSCRLLTTSEKKKEGVKKDETIHFSDSVYKKIPDFSKPEENKNWVSYGFDYNSKEKDRFYMHVTFFSMITLCFTGIIFIFKYYPANNRIDWAQREAFIRLHEREQLGLDPVDCNYVDPSKIILPPDEELLDENIII